MALRSRLKLERGLVAIGLLWRPSLELAAGRSHRLGCAAGCLRMLKASTIRQNR